MAGKSPGTHAEEEEKIRKPWLGPGPALYASIMSMCLAFANLCQHHFEQTQSVDGEGRKREGGKEKEEEKRWGRHRLHESALVPTTSANGPVCVHTARFSSICTDKNTHSFYFTEYKVCIRLALLSNSFRHFYFSHSVGGEGIVYKNEISILNCAWCVHHCAPRSECRCVARCTNHFPQASFL